MNQDFSSAHVECKTHGPLGVITLNRPEALNALTLEMIRVVALALKTWAEDDNIQAVYFTGAGERGFCAGGDIKAFYRAGMDYRRGAVNFRVPAMFFGEEYSLNSRIFHYPKPTISFLNGIALGGGYGIAGNCGYKIVCDETVLGMPEINIGFFPDVGSVYHLLRCAGRMGAFMALTGTHIMARDILYAGLADHFVARGDEKDLRLKLEAGLEAGKTVPEILEQAAQNPPRAEELFEPNADRIAEVFAEANVSGVLALLAREGSDWAAQTMEKIRRGSPTSLRVTAEHLKRAEGKDFDHVIETDFVLAQRFIERSDLYEGIRAAVLDKDRSPQWNPATLEEVLEEDIESYFVPTDQHLRDFHGRAA